MEYFEVIVDAKTGQQTVRPYTQAEIDAAKEKQKVLVRNRRNALLAESDWTQLSDAPVDAMAWAGYRQALRDITSQPSFPDVVWPEKPE